MVIFLVWCSHVSVDLLSHMTLGLYQMFEEEKGNSEDIIRLAPLPLSSSH